MKFDYGTQLSPDPIELSIGTLVKPKLRDITDIKKNMSFDKFHYFEVLIKMTPESFYTKIKGDEGKKYWKSLSKEQKKGLTLYQIVVNDERLLDSFVEIFNFFFEETVIFKEGYFIFLNKNVDTDNDITSDDIRGVVSENILLQVLTSIQQVCCIYEEEEDEIPEKMYKNKLAKKFDERMRKAAKKQKERKKGDINFTLPNLISSVSNRHPTISPLNVWDLTIFQLQDSFNRMQLNTVYEIESTRVSVWGDEKKKFNAALWYKNEYDKR